MKIVAKCINSLVHQQIVLVYKNSRVVVCLNRLAGDGVKYRPELVFQSTPVAGHYEEYQTSLSVLN